MEIIKDLNGDKLVLKVVGELNSITTPEFEEVIKNSLKDVKQLIIDCEKLTYISSAGLRVLLVAHKVMINQGKMILKSVNKPVMEVFEITGFVNVLEIEN